ncbi:MAG: homoserine kinase [Peptoniphilaceae bacterium]|nr:homoserine kinase [Peptoniphilaceae bacterium]MDD7543095.1 homoserine kinase [Peptoniphilaceae bacterium]MDY5766455.1 homoserine kinase [Peptoniphilaceae bacterium]
MEQIVIRVPATSANLGPGFDCLGVALSCYMDVTFRWKYMDAVAKFKQHAFDKSNLPLEAYREYGRKMGEKLPPVSVSIHSHIPTTRGLGSSAACVVAGAAAAAYAVQRKRGVPPQEVDIQSKELRQGILQAAACLEGHPDNAAPAVYGGLCLSAMDGDQIYYEKLSLSKKVKFATIIPSEKLSTKMSRSVLPQSIPRADAVRNLSYLGFLLSGFSTGDANQLRYGLQDCIHQPYRRSLIPEYELIQKAAKKWGACGLVISGAGSTMLAVLTEEEKDFVKKMRSLIPGRWEVRSLSVDTRGARIQKWNFFE